MTNTISILTMNGNIFQELLYNTINELTTKLKIIINKSDSHIYISLLLNENILNENNIFNNFILSNLEDYDYITIIFSQKKKTYIV